MRIRMPAIWLFSSQGIPECNNPNNLKTFFSVTFNDAGFFHLDQRLFDFQDVTHAVLNAENSRCICTFNKP